MIYLSSVCRCNKSSSYSILHLSRHAFPARAFFSSPKLFNMSDMEIELTAPNGVKYKQPLGLFINNEWVKPQKGEKITSINPT